MVSMCFVSLYRNDHCQRVQLHPDLCFRKGMAGALAAFFGCPLGGSLFAMEVNSRFGIEYFEHTIGELRLFYCCSIRIDRLIGSSYW